MKTELIVVLGWTDGFGNDTYVYGIYDSLQTAQAKVPKRFNDDKEPRYVTVKINEDIFDLDWYGATPLFSSKKTKKSFKKPLTKR